MNDDEREAQIHQDAKKAINAILPSERYAVHPDVHFLLHRLNEARRHTEQIRAERNEAYAKFHEAEEEIARLATEIELSESQLSERVKEIARLRTPVGTRPDVMERAALALNRAYHRVVFPGSHLTMREAEITEVAIAITDYGDERAHAAHMAAYKETLERVGAERSARRQAEIEVSRGARAAAIAASSAIATSDWLNWYDLDTVRLIHDGICVLADKPDRTQQNAPDREAEGA